MSWKYLRWDETLFKNPEVFDPDYLPEEFLYRESQLSRLAANLKPAVTGHNPVNCLCLGPPATGKTTAAKLIINDLEENAENVITAYINCQVAGSRHKIFAAVFEKIFKQQPPKTGISTTTLYHRIFERVIDENKTLLLFLDDMNFVSTKELNETLYTLLKAHENYEGIKIGLVGISTDIKIASRLDEFTGSVFHPDEIFFPPYGKDEIRDILFSRAKYGFYEGAITDEALDKIVELAYRESDLRLGIHLLRNAGIEAERKAKRKINIEDVETVYEGGAKIFLMKSIAALNSDEREVLKIAYEVDEITTGELYEILENEVKLPYKRFYDILNKLERLKLIDVVFKEKGKGRTRVILKKHNPETVLEAIKEC